MIKSQGTDIKSNFLIIKAHENVIFFRTNGSLISVPGSQAKILGQKISGGDAEDLRKVGDIIGRTIDEI